MKVTKHLFLTALTLAALSAGAWAQTSDSTAPPPKKKHKQAAAEAQPAATAADVQALKDALAAQQKQIQQLTHQLQQMQQSSQQAQATADDAANKAAAAQTQASQQQQAVVELKGDVADLKTTATSTAMTVQETQKSLKNELESPLAIHFKGITITPGGFLAAESVYRARALGSDINTPFNSVNMPGAGQNKISEFFGSGRQSRIAMLAEGKISNAKLSGYYEADFLSAGVTSNSNQSNSYTLRQRQVWGQAALDNGWSFTGGQMWSLVTETKKGVDNRTEAMPLTIDPAYQVGFSWARQYGFRVAKNFHNRFWLAASLENPQTTFSVTNNAANFAFGSAGNSSGLYNAYNGLYSFNAMPDIIAKAAFEPGFGHYEIFGIFSRFRDRVYPCVEYLPTSPIASLCSAPGATATTGAYNNSRNAGGVGANARVTFFKQLDFGLHALYGNGVGRYGASTLPDATANANGTLAPLRSYQGLATIEWHTPKLDVYLNGGEEYVGRHWQLDPNNANTPVGYGNPNFPDYTCYTETKPSSNSGYAFGSLGSNCTGNTKSTIEGTFGFWYRVYHGPKGRIQFGPQYSYLARNTWDGANAAGKAGALSPHGIDNMILTSFRYYLP